MRASGVGAGSGERQEGSDAASAPLPSDTDTEGSAVREAMHETAELAREVAGEWKHLFDGLRDMAYSPRPLLKNPHYYWSILKGTADCISHNVPKYHSFLVRANPYPKPFRRVEVPLEDGATIRGWLGTQKHASPGVVFVPGTFHTKDDTGRKSKAIKMWRDWGVRVLSVDMRGFGESHGTWGAGGAIERRDILDAARLLLADGATSVTVIGESLGGSAALLAAAEPEAPDLIRGGAIAWGAYSDLRSQVEYATTNPGPRHPFYVPYTFFRVLLWQRTKGAHSTFTTFLEERAHEMGIDLDELYERGSPIHHVDRIRVPTIAVHARDDPIVPVAQAEALLEAAKRNPHIWVSILDCGNHCFFDEADHDWYWGLQKAFLDGVCSPPEAARLAIEGNEAGEALAG